MFCRPTEMIMTWIPCPSSSPKAILAFWLVIISASGIPGVFETVLDLSLQQECTLLIYKNVYRMMLLKIPNY